MSSQQQSNFKSASFFSSTFTSSKNGEAPQTTSHSKATLSDPSGTTVHRSSQQPGQKRETETLRYDSQGRLDQSNESKDQGRIEDVSDADRDYEERIEDEYAKREGGA